MRRAHALTALVLALALPLAGCGGDDDDGGDDAAAEEQETPSGPTSDITAKDFAFDPSEVTLEAGREVTLVLTNEDDVEHNITVEDLDVDEDADGGETGQATVTPDAGTYDFHCEYHPNQMRGPSRWSDLGRGGPTVGVRLEPGGDPVRTTATGRSGVVVKLLALLVVPALLAAACGGDDDDGGGGGGGQAEPTGGASTTTPEDEGEPQTGGTIVYGLEADTSNPWTPQRSTCAISCYEVFNSVYDPLVLPDEDGNPQPNLLESFEPNEDFTEWTLTPREGITFHDGTPFDAEAIRYNIQDQLDSALTQAALKSIESVALNADGTAAVVHHERVVERLPDLPRQPARLHGLAHVAQANKAGTVPETEPVGTGPFVFEEYEVGSHFRRHPQPRLLEAGRRGPAAPLRRLHRVPLHPRGPDPHQRPRVGRARHRPHLQRPARRSPARTTTTSTRSRSTASARRTTS